MKKNKNFENKVIDLYINKNKYIREISKELLCTWNTVSNILQRNNIVKREFEKEFKIPEEEIDKIVNLYKNGSKSIDIANIYKVSNQTIINLLRRQNIIIRKRKDYNKYPCNQDFFEHIDTEEKAYFLGFLYADGNVSKGIRTTVRLTLQKLDVDILNKFKKALDYQCPLSFGKSSDNRQQDRWTLYICNGKIKSDLIKLGCIPAKSLILKFPTSEQVPEHLIHHFIRGYFDGDGCICIKGTPTFSIISTKDMCSSINKIIDKNTYIGIKNLGTHKNNINKIYRISGNKQIKKIFKFLYKDASLYLERKFNKFKILTNK